MKEIWKPVVGYAVEGCYMVSNLGRVKGFYFHNPNRAFEYRVLQQRLNHYGYSVVRLDLSDGKKGGATVTVHPLVATTFVGSRPSEEHEVNHKDCNRANNDARNLEWLTHADNVRYSFAMGMHDNVIGEKNPRAILTWEIVNTIRDSYTGKRGEKVLLAKQYGVTPESIGQVILGKTWLYV
jgi:hypothetical protein